MSLEVLFPGLKENHLSYSRTEAELYRGITAIHPTATSDDVDFTAVQGNIVTRDQTDWRHCPVLSGAICPWRIVDLCPSAVQFMALSKICSSVAGAHVLARNGTGH